MTKDDIISQNRAEVIESAINVEWLMNAIICQHYFKRVTKDFLLEVLYDEYFSFGLKRRIIEKIIEDPDMQQIQNLNRINTIRNYFAHCGQQMFNGEAPPPPDSTGSVPDPRKISRAIDFDKLYEEFSNIIADVEKYLGFVYQGKGGEIHQYKDGHLIKLSK